MKKNGDESGEEWEGVEDIATPDEKFRARGTQRNAPLDDATLAGLGRRVIPPTRDAGLYLITNHSSRIKESYRPLQVENNAFIRNLGYDATGEDGVVMPTSERERIPKWLPALLKREYEFGKAPDGKKWTYEKIARQAGFTNPGAKSSVGRVIEGKDRSSKYAVPVANVLGINPFVRPELERHVAKLERLLECEHAMEALVRADKLLDDVLDMFERSRK